MPEDSNRLDSLLKAVFGTDDFGAIIEALSKSGWFPLTLKLLAARPPRAVILNPPGSDCVAHGRDKTFEVSTSRPDLRHVAVLYELPSYTRVWSGNVDMTTTPATFTIPAGTMKPGTQYVIEFEIDSTFYITGCTFWTCEANPMMRFFRWLRLFLRLR
jgi:hypothetical protein